MLNNIYRTQGVLIKLNQVWGLREINKTNLDIIYETAMALNESDLDRPRFIAIAERWKNCDFSNIVEEHNTMWSLLGGTVGKASGIKDTAVKDVISRLK